VESDCKKTETVERLIMAELKIPQAFLGAATVVASKAAPKKTVLEAKLDMSAEVAGEGVCPACNSPMERVFLEKGEVYTCIPCRVVLPIKDPTL
jgi:uncharacterized protein with PIN domain